MKIKKKQDTLGNLYDEEQSNPIPKTRIYELEFLYGSVAAYSVNIIIENIIYHIDDQGRDTGILEEILDFCGDPDVDNPTGEKSCTKVNKIQRPVTTTKVWDVKFKWRYQSTYLFLPHLSKESNPIEVAEHSMANVYSNQQVFRKWVRKVLNKGDRLVNKVK